VTGLTWALDLLQMTVEQMTRQRLRDVPTQNRSWGVLLGMAIFAVVFLAACGGSSSDGQAWAASTCRSLRPQWRAAAGNYSTMMKSLNDPGATPPATWGQISTDFSHIVASFSSLETGASTTAAFNEVSGPTFRKGRTAAEALALDTVVWAAGEKPPGQGVGGDPNIGISEVRSAVQQLCGSNA
jgi:hypothetical protein